MIHSVALVIADFLFSKDVITEEEKTASSAAEIRYSKKKKKCVHMVWS